MPYLEFTSHFKPLHLQTTLQQSEMQWSVEEWMNKAEHMEELTNKRLLALTQERIADVQRALKQPDAKDAADEDDMPEEKDEEDMTPDELLTKKVLDETKVLAAELEKHQLEAQKTL